MPHYYFHIIYAEETRLDDIGYIFSTLYKATEEAVLLLITLALDAEVFRKPVPKEVAIIQEGKPRTLVALKDAT